ncbi:unnamed protein product [Rhizophagus irregularis]|nr:unnamed protein product [Rhizophagus irregularis]CAB4446321.1 unnamed protein product [Rhizophagus irregularis]
MALSIEEDFFDLVDGLEVSFFLLFFSPSVFFSLRLVLYFFSRIDLLGGIALSIEKRFGFYLVGWRGKISSDCTVKLF